MTNLSLDDVVALNALIVTAIGLTFVLGRKERTPPPLDLSGRRPTALDENVAKKSLVRSSGRVASGYGAAALQRLDEEERRENEMATLSLVESRQLNVFFNWNGHTWDAYEVLGVPAGASRETVIQAFHACRSKSPDSIAFLQAATDAILKR